MKNTSFFKSFLSAAGVFIYVSAVALLMFNSENIFGKEEPSFIIPVFMLLLFIISALITGLLVLGRPIHFYLNGNKKEAFKILFITLGWLIFFLVLVVAILLLV